MTNEFARARYLLKLYEVYFNFGGTWPIENGKMAYGRFAFYVVYSIIQYILQWMKIVYVFGDIGLVMPCLLETTWNTVILPKMIVMRTSKRLPNLINEMMNEMNGEAFETVEQMNCYLYYSDRAIEFAKILILGTTFACLMHFGASLGGLIFAALTINGTIPAITPYHTYVFFEVNYYSLGLFWFVEVLNIWTQIFYAVSLGFVAWMIYHVSGQLSALSWRIRNLDIELETSKGDVKPIFKSIAMKHCYIKRCVKIEKFKQSIISVTDLQNVYSMMNDINEIFWITFLDELFVITAMIIISIYNVVVGSDVVDKGRSVESAIIATVMLALVYAPCAAGERIIIESERVREAYYRFRWYDLPEEYKKPLMICMVGSVKPLKLEGGCFFIFCLSSFIVVLKSAMSYLSVLRTMT